MTHVDHSGDQAMKHTEVPELPEGTALHLGEGLYICTEHDRRVRFDPHNGALYHVAGENAGGACREPVPTRTAYRVPARLYVEVDDKTGDVIRVVLDADRACSTKPTHVVKRVPEDQGWNDLNEVEVTPEDLDTYEVVSGKEWPGWDFGW